MDFAQGLQFGSAWLVNLAFAGLLGVLSARHWLRDAPVGSSCATACAWLDLRWRPLALLCFAGQFAALWSAAATMAGLPPFDAFPALWMMLTATAFGKAGVLGLVCAAALALAGPLLLRGRAIQAVRTAVVLPFEAREARRAANGSPATGAQLRVPALSGADADAQGAALDASGLARSNDASTAVVGTGLVDGGGEAAGGGGLWRLAAACLLAAFAAARVANSHAAENGLMTASMLIEWTHLVLVCLWLGGVTVAAWIVMPRRMSAPAPANTDAKAPVAYMRRLSTAATIAIAGILATGIYNAWHGLGTPANALGNPYGSALIVKVVLVLFAAAMGGYNKLSAFPRAEAGDETALARARLVLQIESIVLAAAMLAAAVLVAQQPPAMA